MGNADPAGVVGGQGDALPTAQVETFQERSSTDRRNSRLLGVRDVFDRIGYGAAPPQFVNILFYLSAQGWPYILFLIGILNGLKTVLSVVWSNILQEYHRMHKVEKSVISAAGWVYGFSFLFLAFALMSRNIWLFSAAFLLGTFGVVAYGDLYQEFIHSVVRRERMSRFFRFMAGGGVLITAAVLVCSGLLLDAFPMTGTEWDFTMFGRVFHLKVYGMLLAFEITAFAFILSGYVTSFIRDPRAESTYSLLRFAREYYAILRTKMRVFWSSKEVFLLTLAGLVTGLLQVLITAYSGIAIYKLLAQRYDAPFFALGIVYAIAIVASFTGPFFTEKAHRSTGLAPTMVFGTLLMAVLPLVLVYNLSIAAITAALCLNVIGGAITGFAQGLLARKLLSDDVRHDFFRAQSFFIVIPYLVLVPALAWVANSISLQTTFLIAAVGMALVVMPLYFWLVVLSQRQHA